MSCPYTIRRAQPWKLIAGAASAGVLIGWSAGAGAQTAGEPTPPPLPPAVQSDAAPNDATTAPQAPAPPPVAVSPAATPNGNFPALRQYNENRGGNGPVPIDGALLARLQQDTGARLTPERVAARSQPRYQAHAPANSNPLVGALQNFESNLRGLFNGGY